MNGYGWSRVMVEEFQRTKIKSRNWIACRSESESVPMKWMNFTVITGTHMLITFLIIWQRRRNDAPGNSENTWPGLDQSERETTWRWEKLEYSACCMVWVCICLGEMQTVSNQAVDQHEVISDFSWITEKATESPRGNYRWRRWVQSSDVGQYLKEWMNRARITPNFAETVDGKRNLTFGKLHSR